MMEPFKDSGDHYTFETVKRTERVVNGRRMIRTETTFVNTQSGKRRTIVEVKKEEIVEEREERSEFFDGGEDTSQSSRGVCDHCPLTHGRGENDVACSDPFDASELNPICVQCGRGPSHARTQVKAIGLKRDNAQWKENTTPSNSRPDPSGASGEPVMEKFSRQVSDFLSCCGPGSYDMIE